MVDRILATLQQRGTYALAVIAVGIMALTYVRIEGVAQVAGQPPEIGAIEVDDMTTLRTSWTSGRRTIEVVTAQQDGQDIDELVAAHKAAVAAMEEAYPPDEGSMRTEDGR